MECNYVSLNPLDQHNLTKSLIKLMYGGEMACLNFQDQVKIFDFHTFFRCGKTFHWMKSDTFWWCFDACRVTFNICEQPNALSNMVLMEFLALNKSFSICDGISHKTFSRD